MSIYNVYLQGEHWKSFRSEVLEKRNSCEKCGTKENLCLHHLTYENLGMETEKDVMVLCKTCHELLHKTTHGAKGRFKRKAKNEYFKNLVKNSKDMSNTEIATLVKLSEYIRWDIGLLIDKRSKRPLKHKDFSRILNTNSNKTINKSIKTFREKNILISDNEGYKITQSFFS